MTSGVSRAFRAWAAVALCSTAALLAGCGAQNENYSARSPVDEESQVEGQVAGSASLAAYPPSPEDVAIGVDTSQYEDTDPSAVTEFRPALERYGTWEDTPTYGTVWIPSPTVVGPDFVPYATAGRWTYDDSWVWVSDYEWGWAPFHYGRWVHVPGRGWAWIAGRRYSGAWVSWAYGPTYMGWAPLGPSWYWYNGVAVGVHVWPTPYYVYCPHHAVFAPSLQAHVVQGPAAAPIAASTPRYIPAQPSVGGPSRIPATPTVNPGPSPTQLGHQLASVPKPPESGGLAKARALATPDQAVRAGARAPASGSGFVAGGSSPRYAAPERDGFATAAAREGSGGSRVGASSARAPTGFSGNNGSSFSGRSAFAPSSAAGSESNSSSSVARSAGPDPWRLDPPQVERSRISAPTRIDPRPSYDSSRPQPTVPAYRSPSYSSPSPSMPSQSAPYRAPSAPVYRAQDSAPYRAPSQPSAPAYRAPSQPSAPVYRAPSQPSAPVYRAPAAPVMRAPAPVYRPSAPAPAPARPSGAGRAVRR